MIQTLLVLFTVSGFNQKWFIPRGTFGECGKILIGDTDRDGNWEFIFTTYGGSYTIYFYELHLPDTWMMDSVPNLNQPLLWDIGDFDLDGFYDLVMQSSWGPPSVGIAIFESPDSFSYPTQEVWRDTVGFALVTPICTYDIDQDGLPEIVKVIGDTTDIDIYESAGNNLYDRICRFTSAATHSPMSTLAFGDFDLDDRNEFVFGYSGGEYSILECTGNNSYQEILLQQLPTLNIKDCFSVPDADGDAKLEFVVKGFVIPSAEIHAFIFEATGDDTYEIIKSFDLFGGSNDYYGGYSDVGDVDGDGIPEIALEGCQNIYIIKSADNDSFYVWDTLPGHSSGSNIRVTNDIDGNGLNEIVVSGANVTRIYEYDGGGIEESREYCVMSTEINISPNPFRGDLKIKFHSPKKQNISISIYDVAGRLVRNLGTWQTEGADAMTWSGEDEAGRQTAPGIYFVQVMDQHTGEQRCYKVLKME